MTTPCLYSIVRYAPYADTEEFANIGVVICAPKEGYFDFRLTKRNDARVRGFFHDDSLFPAAKDAISRELELTKQHAGNIITDKELAQFFRYFTAKKESIFHFSTMRVRLTNEPKKELDLLYSHYVNHINYTKERREEILAAELKRSIERIDGLKNIFRNDVIEGMLTKFGMPLVARRDGVIKKAIKPLSFSQAEPGKMTEHCDLWVNRINRAAEEDLLSADDVLFTIEGPINPTSHQTKAMDVIKRTMDKSGINHCPVNNDKEAIDFAKQAIVVPPASRDNLIR